MSVNAVDDDSDVAPLEQDEDNDENVEEKQDDAGSAHSHESTHSDSSSDSSPSRHSVVSGALSHAPSSCETFRGEPPLPLSDGESSVGSDFRGPIPRERTFDDVLLKQTPQDIRMFIFDKGPDILQEPMSPAEHDHMLINECGVGEGDPWHAFELPLAQSAYDQCFAEDPLTPNLATEDGLPMVPLTRHYQHVLQRAVGNFTLLVKGEKDGAKVMSCGTQKMQDMLTKYVKLIVLRWTRKYFFAKPDDDKDCTMMYVPLRCQDEVQKFLPGVESVTGALTLFFEGPDVEARDVKDKWRKARIDRLVNKDSVSVVVGKRCAEILVEDVRGIERDPDDAIPLAVFAPDERTRLICVAHILRVLGDVGAKLPKRMMHPMISMRKYPPEEEKILISLSQKFERPLSAATNCAVVVAKSQNLAILVGNAAEKQLCAAYIQCMMDQDVPSRADALLMPRPEGFFAKLDQLIQVGEATKALVFIKSDKVVVMSPSFIRRAHAFIQVAHLAEEMDPGYVKRLHFPVDEAKMYKVSEMDPKYTKLDATRRKLYEGKANQLTMATGGVIAILKDAIYVVGTDESKKNILQYTRWFFMNPANTTREQPGPCGKNALCVTIQSDVDVPEIFYKALAKYFKVFTIPYAGVENGKPVQNIWLVGPNRPLTSAATALRWYARTAEPGAMIPSLHTAPVPLTAAQAAAQKAAQAAQVAAQQQQAQQAYYMPQQPQINPLMATLLLRSMQSKRRRLRS